MSEHDDEAQPAKPTPYPRSAAEDDLPVPTDDGAETEQGPSKPRRGPRIGRISARIAVALVSVLALLAMGYGYTVVSSLQGSVHTTDAIGELDNQQGSDVPPEDDGAIDILLVGTDARTDMQGNPLPLRTLKLLRTERTSGVNTDTLIVLRVPKDGSAPTAVSIPRDTWVKTASGDQRKINSVFGVAKARTAWQLDAEGGTDSAEIARKSDQAGRKALIKTVQRFTQVHIDHYAEVNLLGFYLLTKALGGVTVCLKAPTRDKDSGANFRAGVQKLSAAEALSFVRQRKNIPGGGLGRIRRQQAFLAAALRKVLSAGTLSDPAKLQDLADAVHRSVVLDPDLELLEFAEKVKGIASGDVSFITIPVRTIDGHSPKGLSIVKVDSDKVRTFMDSVLQTPESAPTSSSSPRGGGGGSAGALRSVGAGEIPCVY